MNKDKTVKHVNEATVSHNSHARETLPFSDHDCLFHIQNWLKQDEGISLHALPWKAMFFQGHWGTFRKSCRRKDRCLLSWSVKCRGSSAFTVSAYFTCLHLFILVLCLCGILSLSLSPSFVNWQKKIAQIMLKEVLQTPRSELCP